MFCVDSKPVPVCRIARAKRCRLGKYDFAKARKRVETLFSQMVDQFMLCRNYAKQQVGLFARIISKISALTILQYINYINYRPIGQIKHALL